MNTAVQLEKRNLGRLARENRVLVALHQAGFTLVQQGAFKRRIERQDERVHGEAVHIAR